MKHSHIAGIALKTLLLAGLLTACQNEQTVAPTETASTIVKDQNAKGNPLLRLVKRGTETIQYVKSGKFFGKVSIVLDNDFRTEYAYDDSDPNGILKITSKRYKKSTNVLVEEIRYKVLNGLCVESDNWTTVEHNEYSYNAQGLLGEIKHSTGIGGTDSRKFTYKYFAATNAYRLDKIETNPNAGGLIGKVSITYSSKPDNYSTNPQYTGLDRHLPIFGKFSDVLPKQYIEYPIGSPTLFHEYVHGFNSDGYVIWEQIQHSNGSGSQTWFDNVALQYSSNWQGI